MRIFHQVGAWVGSSVDLEQMSGVEVSINLGRRDASVPEQLLHLADRSTRLENMGRAGVPEHVRVHVRRNSLAARPEVDSMLHDSRSEASSTALSPIGIKEPGMIGVMEPALGAENGHP
jgi:hypothetical protein